MAHSHGDGDGEHSHGGSAPGLWDVIDALMLTCAVIVAGLWAEVLWKAWKAKRADRVRYSLTPEGEAAATPTPRVGVPGQPPLVDLSALAELAERDQEAAAKRDAAAVLDEVAEPPTGTDWLRRRAQQ